MAIVGTRKASRYGWDVAFQLASQLARQGVTIISGLAHGIDAAAHQGALAAGGKTIAVVATGIDKVYPRENTELAAEIAAKAPSLQRCPWISAPWQKLPAAKPNHQRTVAGRTGRRGAH